MQALAQPWIRSLWLQALKRQRGRIAKLADGINSRYARRKVDEMWQVVISFLAGLFAGYKARTAAKAGSELPQGEAQVKAADENVTAIEVELRRVAPTGRPN